MRSNRQPKWITTRGAGAIEQNHACAPIRRVPSSSYLCGGVWLAHLGYLSRSRSYSDWSFYHTLALLWSDWNSHTILCTDGASEEYLELLKITPEEGRGGWRYISTDHTVSTPLNASRDLYKEKIIVCSFLSVARVIFPHLLSPPSSWKVTASGGGGLTLGNPTLCLGGVHVASHPLPRQPEVGPWVWTTTTTSPFTACTGCPEAGWPLEGDGRVKEPSDVRVWGMMPGRHMCSGLCTSQRTENTSQRATNLESVTRTPCLPLCPFLYHLVNSASVSWRWGIAVENMPQEAVQFLFTIFTPGVTSHTPPLLGDIR